jgi:hypothetical protein
VLSSRKLSDTLCFGYVYILLILPPLLLLLLLIKE